MRTNRLFLALLVAMLCMCNLSAQEVIPVASTQLLNERQQSILETIRKQVEKRDNKIVLPNEIHALFGDSVSSESIFATPLWNEAYFVSGKGGDFNESMVVPLSVESKYGDIYSELCVVQSISCYHQLVTTVFDIQDKTLQRQLLLESSVKGNLIAASIYEGNDVVMRQEYSVSDDEVSTSYNRHSPSPFKHKDLYKRVRRRADTTRDKMIYRAPYNAVNHAENRYRLGKR